MTTNSRSTSASGIGLQVTFADTSDWDGGFIGQVSIANTGSATVNGWTIGFDLANDVTSIWGAQILSHAGTHYEIGSLSYDASIAAASSVSFGFQSSSGNPVLPVSFTVNGQTLTGAAATATSGTTTTTATTTATTIAATSTAVTGHLLPAGFLSTSGNQIVDAGGTKVKITAVNWYGMETDSYAPQGLWAQSYKTMMNQMVTLGFNAIRLPFSLQLFQSGSVPSGIDFSKNPDLAGLTGPQIMDKIVDYAGTIGLKIILDNHRSAAGGGPNDNGLWYDSGYTEAQWIANWKALAARYAGNATIIGADLSNEPHGAATWGDGSATDWQAAATRAGDAIQSVNGNWLMLVEGVQNYDGHNYWWGGNLMGAASHPVTLTVPNKLVYSTHDYPASVSAQSWFSAGDYPNNLAALWTANWGYLYQNGTAPVLVGEYGTKLETASDKAWLAKLVAYMATPTAGAGDQGISWAYWDWNPTSGDTGGILEDDWSTVDAAKLAAIAPGFYAGAAGTKNFLYADVTTGASGGDDGTAYTGPVSYLAHQYIWSGSDAVAVRATVPNVFLHGGSGDDALAAIGGRNVLDGGTGSNFLVGTTGADGGTDTFFLDGRGGGTTWGTVVNFHRGDSVTLWGFHPGTSTRPLTPTDGAAGYTGATIHSELGGAGTGVNASVTFAGLGAATVAGFAFTTGTVGGSDYLAITYT